AEAPADGLLVEVSVPYSDVRWGPSTDYYVAYRLYYGSTHWITEVLSQPDGGTWYKVYDDRKKLAYWGHAEHFRPVPEAELTPIHPEMPADEKWLQVNLAGQWVTAFEG
ncbi:MAG: hypothetical protein HY784_08065, partial [Chloroflexi bacterium]|nr:hypothetical protein [Chloroflexota bacterium]